MSKDDLRYQSRNKLLKKHVLLSANFSEKLLIQCVHTSAPRVIVPGRSSGYRRKLRASCPVSPPKTDPFSSTVNLPQESFVQPLIDASFQASQTL